MEIHQRRWRGIKGEEAMNGKRKLLNGDWEALNEDGEELMGNMEAFYSDKVALKVM